MKMTITEMIEALESQGYEVSSDNLVHGVFPYVHPLVDDNYVPVTSVERPDGKYVPMYAAHTFEGAPVGFYTYDQPHRFEFDTQAEADAFLKTFLTWYADCNVV